MQTAKRELVLVKPAARDQAEHCAAHHFLKFSSLPGCAGAEDLIHAVDPCFADVVHPPKVAARPLPAHGEAVIGQEILLAKLTRDDSQVRFSPLPVRQSLPDRLKANLQ